MSLRNSHTPNLFSRLLLIAVAAVFCLGTGPLAAQTSVTQVQIPVTDPVHNVTSISGWLYQSSSAPTPAPAMVLMHGCSGIWSNRTVQNVAPGGFPNLQNHLDKWAFKLANEGYAVLVVDSFTDRQNPLYTSLQWQDHCNSTSIIAMNHRVDHYTTRVNDIMAAYEFLATVNDVDLDSVGLLGWSAGAEAVMIQLAATPRLSNTVRPASELVFKVGVTFYPGCGGALGFNSPFSSYWRPYVDMRMNMGTLDSFHSNCLQRMNRAATTYGATPGSGYEAWFVSYPGAKHSFDAVSQAYPASECDPYVNNDECAMRSADIRSLAFLNSHLK